VNDQDLYKGLIRIHILHHASEKAVFGLWFIEELAHHGYKLSPGTLYPILHGMEVSGYLRSSVQRAGRQSRRVYRATLKGKKALAIAKERVRELFGELVNE
jgi:DNA-binding PadR family transcriptional regulator